MKTKEKNNIIFIRLYSEEDVNTKLKEVCKIHKISTGIILSGIGQLKDIKLGYFKEKGNYTPKTFIDPYELLSLTGNICKNGDNYFFHFHALIGDKEKKVYGGHFIEGKVTVTCEIIILKSGIKTGREYNEKTGLKNLILK